MGQLRNSLLNPAPRPLITLPRVTPAMLDVLDFMQDYDVIPATYVKAQFGAWHGTRLILAAFGNAHYIRVPTGYAHINARNRPRPLELTDLGRRALGSRYRHRIRVRDYFEHRYMRSVIQYSFAQAPKENPRLTFHSEADIINHPDTPEATRNETNPSWFDALGQTVRPDAPIFGYEYRVGDSTAYMYFQGFEADRATERQDSESGTDRKTIKGMILRYADYLERGGFKDKYGLSQINVPIITIGPARMQEMLKTVRTAVDPRIQRAFIFKCVPDFLNNDPLPPASGHLVTEPWERVDGPFSILETLKTIAERKANARL